MLRAPRAVARAALGLALGFAAACAAAPPPPYQPDALPFAANAAPGTPLTGPLAEPLPSADPDAALRLFATVFALADADLEAWPALDTAAVLVTERPGGLPLQPAPSPGRGLRLLRGPEVDALLASASAGEQGRQDLLARQTWALPEGATVSLRLGTAPERAVELAVFRSPGPRLAVLLRRPPLARDALAEDDAPGRGRPVSSAEWPLEISVLDEQVLPLGGRCALLLPAPQEGWPRAALAVEFELRAPPSPGHPDRAAHEAAVARGAELMQRAAESVTRRSRVAPLALSDALSALTSAVRRAPALVYLASTTGAQLAEDLALGGDALLLGELARAVLEAEVTDTELGFFLEGAALRLLAARAESGDALPEHAAWLVRRAGQLARDPALLVELLAQAGDLGELLALFVEENRAFLGDVEPAARVRAYDWLDAQGLAPTGFDPLASREERRAALEAALRRGAP